MITINWGSISLTIKKDPDRWQTKLERWADKFRPEMDRIEKLLTGDDNKSSMAFDEEAGK